MGTQGSVSGRRGLSSCLHKLHCPPKMADFPDIKTKHSLVAKHVTPSIWEKLGAAVTQTSGFTLAKAIACAVEFNKHRLGYSEVQLVQKMIDGVNTLVKEDRELQAKHGM